MVGGVGWSWPGVSVSNTRACPHLPPDVFRSMARPVAARENTTAEAHTTQDVNQLPNAVNFYARNTSGQA